MSTGRVPPHDRTIERALIGSCMLVREIQQQLVDVVEPDDFYIDAHGVVWRALRACEKQGVLGDTVSLRAELEAAGKLQAVGGDEFLFGLTDTIPTLANAEALARRVRDLAAVRAVIHAAHTIAAEGYEYVEDVPSFLARAERGIATAAESRSSEPEPITLGAAAERSLERLVARQSGSQSDGAPISTGLHGLDWMLGGGLWPGRLYIFAGRPGMGKSALGEGAAIAVGKVGPALVCSLEMPAEELGDRAISLDAQIDGELIRAGKLSSGDMSRMFAACARLQGSNVWVDDSPGVSVTHVKRVARRHKRRHGLACIVVDYLQLMRGERRADNREQEISDISRSLKALAKELFVPVIALSQLNRKCEDRADKRPQMGDLRESGAIEQDADCIVFVYRDDVYNPESPKPGMAELIVAKQRGGRTGTVEAVFRKEMTAFFDVDRHHGGHA